MLRLSKMTDYGALLMTHLAQQPTVLHSAHEIAEVTHIAEPTVSKLLKALAKVGLLESVRGASGGYRLSRAPERISVAEIVTALEGPIGLTECASAESDCTIQGCCGTRPNWQRISDAIRIALENVSLAEMAQPMQTSPVITLHRASGADLRLPTNNL